MTLTPGMRVTGAHHDELDGVVEEVLEDGRVVVILDTGDRAEGDAALFVPVA